MLVSGVDPQTGISCPVKRSYGESSNGKSADFEFVNPGSNPGSPVNVSEHYLN